MRYPWYAKIRLSPHNLLKSHNLKMEKDEVARLEIDLKRLLLRMQGALAGASHASVSQDEMIRRWTYFEFAQNLLRKLAAELTGDEESKRIATYEEKLNFISQMMCVFVCALATVSRFERGLANHPNSTGLLARVTDHPCT